MIAVVLLALHLSTAVAQDGNSSDSSSRSEESSSKSSSASSKTKSGGDDDKKSSDSKSKDDSDSKKADSKSSSSKKSDSDKSSSSKTDSKKADSKKTDTKKTDSKSSSKDDSTSEEDEAADQDVEADAEVPSPEPVETRKVSDYDDLLRGPAPAVPPPLPVGALPGPEESSPWSMLFVLFGVAMLAGGYWFLRQRGALSGLPGVAVGSSADPLRVVSRSYVSSGSSLVLLDVQTFDGGRRRLLVGVGSGSPTLVADLGDDLPASEYAGAAGGGSIGVQAAPLEAFARPVERYESAPTSPPAPSVSVTTGVARDDVIGGTPTGVGSPVQRFVAASKLAGEESPPPGPDREQRRRAARNLLDDVLATRGEGGQRRR